MAATTVDKIKKGDTFKLATGSDVWHTVARVKPLNSDGNDGREVKNAGKRTHGPVYADRVIIEYVGGGRDIYCTVHRVLRKKK